MVGIRRLMIGAYLSSDLCNSVCELSTLNQKKTPFLLSKENFWQGPFFSLGVPG